MRTQHPQSDEATALWIEHAGRCVVFTGDTAYHLPVGNFARRADGFNREDVLAVAAEASAARMGGRSDRLKRVLYGRHTGDDPAGNVREDGAAAPASRHLIRSRDPAGTEGHLRNAVRLHGSGLPHAGMTEC